MKADAPGISAGELKAILALTGVYICRMLGLFMVLPVMLTFGEDIAGASPQTLGLALGIYGVSQAVLQIPLGWLSDRLGRKKVIIAGLLVFLAGSLVAAFAQDVHWLIAGRLLQGAGAIASSTMALLTDLVREENRTKAMAIVGISIGASFTLAMILGPWMAAWQGLTGVFGLTALLAAGAILLVMFVVPAPLAARSHAVAPGFLHSAAACIRNPGLWRLDIGILILHMGMVALFVAVPLMLEQGGIPRAQHGWVYIPVMILAFLLMAPFMAYAEKKQKLVQVFSAFIIVMLLSQLALWFSHSVWWLAICLTAYFCAFNYLEAAMPSMISRIVSGEIKGTALGVFSTCQFLGAAVGGMLGGAVVARLGLHGVVLVTAVMTSGWFLISLGQPRIVKSGNQHSSSKGVLGSAES